VTDYAGRVRLRVGVTQVAAMGCGLGSAVISAPASGGTAPVYYFSTPSRNIICEAGYPNSRSKGFVDCDVLSTFGGPEGYPKAGFLPVRGKAYIFRASNAGNPKDSMRHPIPYGQSWHHGYLTCRSRSTGLTCVSSLSTHGFFLSRESQRAW
jgi:hypothetical protein